MNLYLTGSSTRSGKWNSATKWNSTSSVTEGASLAHSVIKMSGQCCLLILALVFMAITFTTQSANAQSRNAGEIRGTVLDTTGAVISGVQVVATENSTGVAVKTKTGDSGVYDMPYVSSGQYSVSFMKDGFQTYVAKGVGLHIETITVNAIMQVGAVSNTITITAAPDLLQTESTEISTILPTTEVTELPIVGGNWQSLAELIPGVAPSKGNTSTATSTVSVNGGQQFQSSWLIDGGASTLPISYNPDLLSPPLETISEIDMVTSGFGAESGNGLATFNVITKSGTNSFHGAAYEYNQNDIYDAAAKNWTSTPHAKAPVRWNEYGGTVGGPILRNKLFFFFGYQGNKIGSSASGLYSYPTDDIRAGDFSNSAFATIYDPATTATTAGVTTRQPFANNTLNRIDPVAAAIQKFFPEPNVVNVNSPYTSNYYYSAPAPITQNWYNWKIDGNLSPDNHIYTSGEFTKQNQVTPAPDCPIDCGSDTISEISSQLTDAWSITSNKLNEFRVSVAREKGIWTPVEEGAGYPTQIGLPLLPENMFPVVTASGGTSTYTMGGSEVQAILAETSITGSDTFSWILGKHTIKVGGEYDYWTDNDGWDSINAGNFNFNGIGTRDPSLSASSGIGYADFLLGYTSSWSVSEPAEYGGRVHNEQLFAQDYYKLRPNLTINVGARMIHQLGWTDEHNHISLYDPNLINPATSEAGALGYAGVNLPKAIQSPIFFYSPRVGFAWTPKSLTSIRGGFGFYPFPWSGNGYLAGDGTGWGAQGALQSSDNLTDVFMLQGGPPAPVYPTAATRTPTLLNGQSVPYIPYNSPMSYSEQYQLSVERQFGNYLFSANYVGNVVKKLGFPTDINQATDLTTGVRPNTTYQSINATMYTGNAKYNSLQLVAKRQFKNGLSFLANYTFAKGLDTGTGTGGNGSGIDYWQNAYSPAANYSVTAENIRHLLNGSVVYQLPFGKGKMFLNNSKLLDVIIGGWQASTAYTYHAGMPFTPTMGTANLSYSQSGTWYPNRVSSGKLSNRTAQEWFDTSAFVEPSPHTFGNSERNILTGPRYADADLSLAKTFGLDAFKFPMTFQLKMQATDIFNHPNYSSPNALVGSGAAYGTITSSLTNRAMQVGGVFRF